MSLEIPLLIREKLDYYLYFRVWLNRVKAVNSEYSGSIKEYGYFDEEFVLNPIIFGFSVNLRGILKSYNFRCLSFDDGSFISTWQSIRNFRDKNVGQIPKHYHYTILKEML